MKHRLLGTGTAIAFALLLSACDGSDSSGSSSPNLDTGLEDKTLSSLSQGEIDKLNQAIADYMANAISKADMCKFSGVMSAAAAGALGGGTTDAAIQKACTDIETACQNSTGSTTTTSEPNLTTATLASCDAKVGELETCMKDSIAATNTLIDAIPACSNLTASTLSTSNDMPTVENPASCTALQTKCPNLSTSSSTT